MAHIGVKLPDGSAVTVSVEALRRRLVASSPLLVLLQQELEQSSLGNCSELDILNELPAFLLVGNASARALRILFEHLGSDTDDPVGYASLQSTLSVPIALNMHAIADWLLAEPITRHLATWFCKKWLENPESILSGLSGVSGTTLQACVRSHLFTRSSIPETSLAEILEKKLSQSSSSQSMTDWSGLRSLRSALLAMGFEAGRPPVEPLFPVFVKFQGQSFVVRGCTPATDAQELKSWMAGLTGVPETLQRIEFRGKPLPNVRPMVSFGVRRDSTLNLALRPQSRPTSVPHTVHIRCQDSQQFSVTANDSDTPDTLLAKLEGKLWPWEGKLFYNGHRLRGDHPLPCLNLPDAPIFLFVQRRVRRRVTHVLEVD